MQHPVLAGVAERGERLMAQATGSVLALEGGAALTTLRAAAAGSVDTVTTRFVFCAVPNVADLLGEVDRVLVEGGRLLLLEHYRAPGTLGRVQDVWSPGWNRVPGGCRPNREPIGLLRANGFAITDCDRFTARGIPILSRYLAAVAIRKAQAPAKEDEQQ